MPAPAPNPYLRTKVLTASPAELRMMLFDGAIRFLEQGKRALLAADYEQAYNSLTRTQNILIELINALRPEHDPELCEKLSALYTFMYMQIVSGLTERDVDKLDEVHELLTYERDTWRLLLEQLESESGEASDETTPSGDGGFSAHG
jgi:flagellar protein FliS